MAESFLFPTVVPLSEVRPDEVADFFAQLSSKEELKTREGKPYFKVAFRDALREVKFPIWEDSPWAAACRDEWTPGGFYKIRATLRDTSFGLQMEIEKIRAVEAGDAQRGFDPLMLQPRSRFDPERMLEELRAVITDHINDLPLRKLVLGILARHEKDLLTLPAATRNHHAMVSGWLEHVLSVTRTCVYLAEKYRAAYPELRPPLDVGLVVAGGVLHDIGKLRELRLGPTHAEYTAPGVLIGHVLQGRDMVREAAQKFPIPDEQLLRLEHIIVSHQRLPEWGSPKPPMTPEALLVHYADDIDAKYNSMAAALMSDDPAGEFTSRHNALRQAIFRGESGIRED